MALEDTFFFFNYVKFKYLHENFLLPEDGGVSTIKFPLKKKNQAAAKRKALWDADVCNVYWQCTCFRGCAHFKCTFARRCDIISLRNADFKGRILCLKA